MKWNVGIVQELYQGRNGVVTGAKLKARKSFIDTSLQLLYPLEFFSKARREPEEKTEKKKLTSEAVAFRTSRRAAEMARQGIQAIREFESS